jgi:hypothetical protein
MFHEIISEYLVSTSQKTQYIYFTKSNLSMLVVKVNGHCNMKHKYTVKKKIVAFVHRSGWYIY